MYFETAGIEASPIILAVVAFSISFFTSMGGVSGAFLLLPFQMSVLGFTSPAVSPTNQVFNITAIPVGLGRFNREGRMVWPLVLAVALGTIPGVAVGVLVRVRYLPDPTRFKAFVGCVLLVIGVRMVFDLARAGTATGDAARAAEDQFRLRVNNGAAEAPPAVEVRWRSPSRVELELLGHRFACNLVGIALLSLVVGAIGGAYGIGGGSIMAPFFVAVLGMPVYAVAGAALAGTLLTSVTAVTFYHAIAPLYPDLAIAPDWRLGMFLGLGGVAGIWLGARCQKHVPARLIKAMLCVIVLFTSMKYLGGVLP